MLMPILALVLGIVFLAISADKFVQGAAVGAGRLGIPPILVGMLVIGFGSSMPEFVVSVTAATDDNPGLALGNALGSNISNIALILGISALLKPIRVQSTVLRRELPILVFVTIVCTLLLGSDGYLSRADGQILIGLFIVVMSWSIYTGLTEKTDEFGLGVEENFDEPLSNLLCLVYLVGGLGVLVISSQTMVWGGVALAKIMGISDLIIGLTIIALGTSLPELAASIAALKRNEHDLALGNIIGSNLFNTTIVIGVAGVISPTAIEPEMISRDIPILIAFTLLLFVFCYSFTGNESRINRVEAIALLVCYVAYNLLLLSYML